MFDHTSRYYHLETVLFETADGRMVSYVRRRFLPQGEKLPLLVEATVRDGERLDLLTHRTLGEPTQFWRIADANNAMNPFDLTAESESGADALQVRTLRIPVPQVEA